ncbi:MAG: alpha/beta fold hydrolase [Candidatus Cloacimonadia bacterium]
MRRLSVLLIVVVLMMSLSCFAKSSESFIGNWAGRIIAAEVEVEISLEIVDEGDEVSGLLSVPLQQQFDVPVVNLKIDQENISFKVEFPMPVHMRGKLSGDQIEGQFTQGGVNGTFKLTKSDKKDLRPQELVMPPLEGERNVSVETTFGKIYGSLVVPQSNEKMPLVIIIPGSGPTDRNGNNPLIYGNSYVYRQIANELLKEGIASLRFDKRGIGESVEALLKEEDLRITYYIRDVSSWINMFAEDERFSKIVLLGHSEGALIGLMASRDPKVDGFISLAGPGRNMAEILREQFAQQPPEIQEEAYKILDELTKMQTHHNVSDVLKPVFRIEIQPFIMSMIRIEPKEEFAKLNIPALILQGTTDLQVSVEDAKLLSQANKQAELKIIDGMNHMMRDTSLDFEENLKSYGDPEMPLNSEFVDTMIRFMKRF